MTAKSREPCAKGTSFLPLVVAIKNLPNARELVPKKLWKYLDTPIIVSGWYPERDFFQLIEAFVTTMDRTHRCPRVSTNSVIVVLKGFSIPLEGYCRLQVAYTEEYRRLVGIDVTGKVLRSTARGDPFCEWEHTLGRTPASEAFIASLPPLPER